MARPAELLSIGRSAQRLASGYYAFLVAHLVAVNPQSINSLRQSPRQVAALERVPNEVEGRSTFSQLRDERFQDIVLMMDGMMEGAQQFTRHGVWFLLTGHLPA